VACVIRVLAHNRTARGAPAQATSARNQAIRNAPTQGTGARQAAGSSQAKQLAALEADLRTMVPQSRFRLDVPGWFGT